MLILADVFLAIVAILHVLFMILESFFWESAFAKKRFVMSDQKAKDTAVLAKNQGLYNLFLAGGLVFAQWYRGESSYAAISSYFLACVIAAGIVGGLTVSKRIFYIQAVPAILAIIFVNLAH